LFFYFIFVFVFVFAATAAAVAAADGDGDISLSQKECINEEKYNDKLFIQKMLSTLNLLINTHN